MPNDQDQPSAAAAKGTAPRGYPRETTLAGSTGRPLHFRVYNDVENHRINHYGGEKPFLDAFLAALRPTDTVFDIGASVGLMTVHAAEVLEAGVVYAFEPDPENRDRLKENVSLNGFNNVRFIEWAVGDQPGRTTLLTDGSGGCAPTLREQPDRPGAPRGRVEVEIDSLDAAVKGGRLPIPDVVKVDIEGGEILFLRGARGLLGGAFAGRPRIVLLEVHPAFLPQFDSGEVELRDMMSALGYRLTASEQRAEQLHWRWEPSRA